MTDSVASPSQPKETKEVPLRRNSSVTIDMSTNPSPNDVQSPLHVRQNSTESTNSYYSQVLASNDGPTHVHNSDAVQIATSSVNASANTNIVIPATVKHRISRTQTKPMLSSLEEFDPSMSANWIKQQFNNKIKQSPQYQEAIKYAQIDFYRRYFYIEPQQLQQRLTDAYKPSWPRLHQEVQLLIYGTTNGAMVSPKKISPELYGPLMIVLTLAAIIPFDMHHASASSHPGSLRETTLISSALITSFSYWAFATILTFWIVQHTKTLVNVVQVASIVGYSMTAICVVIGLGGITERATISEGLGNATAYTNYFNNTMFYLLWIAVGGVANLRLALTLVGRTPHASQDRNDFHHRLFRLTVGILPFTLNMLFMLYLHFSYHYFVEAVIDQIPE